MTKHRSENDTQRGPTLAAWVTKLNVNARKTSQRRTGSLAPLSDMEDERGYLLVPHEPDCDGFWMVLEHGDMAEIKCNSCGAVIDTVPIDRASQRLMELAGAQICSARCPHCGAAQHLPRLHCHRSVHLPGMRRRR